MKITKAAKDKFEKWFIKYYYPDLNSKLRISREQEEKREQIFLRPFYLSPFDFQLGVWLAYFRERLGAEVHFYKMVSSLDKDGNIVPLEKPSWICKTRGFKSEGDTFEEAFENLKTKILEQ